MSEIVVLRLEGETEFLVVDRANGTVTEMDLSEAAPIRSDGRDPEHFRGIAEAYALPSLPAISSRKHYLS